MPQLAAVGTALPSHELSQDQARSLAGQHFARLPGLGRLLSVFDHAGVERRYLARAPAWLLEGRSFAETNEVFIREATQLAVEAGREALRRAGLTPGQIDYLLVVTTTGLATPSLDARVMNALSFSPHTRRTPIWGLGCAGGAAGLAHAFHYARGNPGSRVLLICVELCSLTFLADDLGKSNLVAAALFGDGAGAAVVVGDDAAAAAGGCEILATRSTFYPDSLDIMGWNVRSRGLQVVFNRRIPQIVEANAREELVSFLSECSLKLDDIHSFLYHPGGSKVLQAYLDAYGVSGERFRYSIDTLRRVGNLSSATVLFVLEQCLAEDGLPPGAVAVTSALGPGFCSETLLLRGLPR